MIQIQPLLKILQSVIHRSAFFVGAALILAASIGAQQPCGGEQRWAVKVAADADNGQIDLQPVPISIHDLATVQKLGPIPQDDFERLPTERTVYVVDGFLVKFKREAG